MPFMGVHELKYARIDADAAGNVTVQAAVTGRRVVVLGYVLTMDAATALPSWTSGVGGTVLAGPYRHAANGGVAYAGSIDAPAFQTGKGEALVLNTAGVGLVDGHVTYVLVG